MKKLFLCAAILAGVASADIVEKKLFTDYKSTQIKMENVAISKLILEYYTNDLQKAEFIFLDSNGNVEFKLKCAESGHFKELICKY